MILLDKETEFIVNVIGYEKQGESIVCLIKSDNEILFSAVIDCYEKKGTRNITQKILEDNKISSVDVIIWTHTDADHSKGLLNIIDKYANSETVFAIPNGLDKFSNRYNKGIIKKIVETISAIENPSNVVQGVYGVNISNLLKKKFYTIEGSRPIGFGFNILAPTTKITLGEELLGIKDTPNSNSIVCDIEFGMLNIILTGDADNRSIDSFVKTSLIKPFYNYCKIPHHGSKGSDSFLKIQDDFEVVTSTIYSNHELPSSDVLERYANKSKEIYITGGICSKHDHGIVRNIYKPLKYTDTEKGADVCIEHRVELVNNAYEYKSKNK